MEPLSVIEEVQAERNRQIAIHGWTPEHDDTHDKGEIAYAAAAYATAHGRAPHQPPHPWYKSGKSRRRECIVAAALLVAEIERLDRAKSR